MKKGLMIGVGAVMVIGLIGCGVPQADYDSLQGQNQALNEKLAALQQQVMTFNNQLSAITSEKEDLARALEESQTLVTSLETTIEQSDKAQATLEGSMQALKAQYDALIIERDELLSRVNGLEDLLDKEIEKLATP